MRSVFGFQLSVFRSIATCGTVTCLLLTGLYSLPSFAIKAIPRTPAPKDAKVYFITPKNGDVIKGDVLVKFGLSGMGVAPAGIVKENTGHHHLLIDTEIKDWGFPIVMDDQHKHFGGGQTETTLKLTPGKHTLQLVLADHIHVPHQPPVTSEKITITVEK